MHLIINGKAADYNCKTAYDLRNMIGQSSDVLIINGFQLKEDYSLAEGDCITIIPKGKMPDYNELEAMMAARHTPYIHQKLKQGKVAIAGLGGLGSNIAVMLARIGVGTLLLVDFDIVEPSNLNRQSYYIQHLGMPKTKALKAQLQDINPFISLHTETVRVSKENIVSIFSDYPLICEAFDDPTVKAMLVNTVLNELPASTIVSASGMAGFDSANRIQTTHPLKQLYVCGDLTSEAKFGNGLMAPRVQVCAGHQANMILRLLLEITEV